jgi:hypothetical protein
MTPEGSAAGTPIGSLHEVRAHFSDADRMQAAIDKLALAGFDRADLNLPVSNAAGTSPETRARPADTDEDARQARTMHTSTGAAIAAMAGAGVTLATGGAAAPAVAAAFAAGGLVGGGIFAVSSMANSGEQSLRDAHASAGMLVLSVRAPDPVRQQEAEAILQAAGGTELTRT